LEARIKITEQFDHQDFVDIHFTYPVEKIIDFSFPISKVLNLGLDGDANDRWRLHFKPTATFPKGELIFGGIVKHRGVTWTKLFHGGKPIVRIVEMCPCSISGPGSFTKI